MPDAPTAPGGEPDTRGEAAPEPVPPVGSSQPAPEVFQTLDARVIRLWRLRQSLFAVVVSGLLLMPGLGIGWGTGQWLGAGAGWILLAGLLGFRVWWHPPRAYRGWGYRLDERVLEIKEGIWFRSLTLLPLSRIQHVDLDAGPLERGLGLASLIFHTAGTHNAIIVLPGLDAGHARHLRDRLIAIGGDDAV